VICQLRFPPILRIESSPADFQDMVRNEFPDFVQTSEVLAVGPSPFVAQIPVQMASHISNLTKTVNYEFASEDGAWKTNLTRDFVSLSASSYRHWETFREKLQVPLHALIAVYKPRRFSRIGLRYVDVIQRSTLDLDDVSWSELLQPQVLGILGSPDVANSVRAFRSSYELALENDQDSVRIVTSFWKNTENGETCYVIDSDFFTSQPTPLEGASEKLEYFNVRASRLIRWCITERLHSAMEPTNI